MTAKIGASFSKIGSLSEGVGNARTPKPERPRSISTDDSDAERGDEPKVAGDNNGVLTCCMPIMFGEGLLGNLRNLEGGR